MTDREIFRDNLNYYLETTGKLQKDLADYVGAGTTTVSGWTRGISYPRADAMEKIAMFFGIKTSQLIGARSDEYEQTEGQSEKVRVLMHNISQLNPEEVDQLTEMFNIMFSKKLKKGNHD